MTFTAIFALFAFVILCIVFGAGYAGKGLKYALWATGITFGALLLLFVATLYAITAMMPN